MEWLCDPQHERWTPSSLLAQFRGTVNAHKPAPDENGAERSYLAFSSSITFFWCLYSPYTATWFSSGEGCRASSGGLIRDAAADLQYKSHLSSHHLEVRLRILDRGAELCLVLRPNATSEDAVLHIQSI